ncbi:MAG: HEAT repeat domain-containing protein [Verrucomicrobiota bacterium]
MKRRLAYLALVGLLLLGGVLLWRSLRPGELRHQDRTVSEWLRIVADPKSDVLLRDEAESAFISLGTNALPVLTNRLFTTETLYSRWRQEGGEKWPAIIRERLPDALPAALWRRAAAKQLTLLGSDTAPVSPLLAAALADPDRVVRGYCYNLLNRLRAPADVIVPGLLTALRSPDPAIRVFGAGELGFIGPDAKAGVSALIIALDDQDESVRLNAIIALGRIGPAALPSIPTLRELLKNPKPEVRLNAATTLTRLDIAEAKFSVPVLAALLKHEDQSMIEVALRQLSDLGVHAAAAVPQVEALLDHPDATLRRLAEEALSRMDKGGRSL